MSTLKPVAQVQVNSGKYIEHPNGFIENVMTFGARKPIITALIVLVITIVTSYGLLSLKIDADPDSLINNSNPILPVYQAVVKEFGSDNIVLVHYQGDDIFSPKKLKLIDEVAYQLKKLPSVEKVETLSTALSIRDNGSGLEINPLINTYPETIEETAAIKNNALYSPLFKNELLSEDGTKAALVITLKPSFHESEFNRTAFTDIERIITPLKTEFSHVFQVGTPRINSDLVNGLFEDILLITPLDVGVLMITLIFMLRVFWAAFIPMSTSVISVIWTFGILGYCNIPVNLLVAVLPGLIIVIGSTEDTHIVAAYLQGLKIDNTRQRFPAIRYMAAHVGVPIFITSFSTIIGFLSNAITDMTLIRDFAIASSIGMLATAVSTLLLAPLLLSIVGPTTTESVIEHDNPKSWKGGFVRFVVNAVEFHQGKIFGITTVIVLVYGGFALQITASNDPLAYFNKDHQLIFDYNMAHQDLAGMQVFSLTIEASANTDFKNPTELEKLDAIQKAMLKAGAFDKVTGITDYLKLVNQEMHQGDKNFYTLPNSRDLVEQYLMLFQRNDLERVISSDARRANFVVRHNMSDSSLLNAEIASLKTQLKDILGNSNRFYLTGKNLMTNEAAESLFSGQGYSLLIAIASFSIIMTLLYSSPVAGLMSMIPNVIPIVLMFGIMGMFDIPLNPGTAMVAVIALGIAIDDTIHIFSTYNRECRIDGDQNAAAVRSIRLEALGVMATSFSLAAGFFTLQFSSFRFVGQFGMLAALTMLIAMVTELFLSPVLLKNIRLVGIWDIIDFDLDRKAIEKAKIFAGMTLFQIKRVILLSKMREYQPGDIVIQQGMTGNELFIILSGQAEVLIGENDNQKLITKLGWSDNFGEAGYAGYVMRTATVRVADDSGPFRVVMLNQEQVEKAMRFYPRLHAKLNSNISKELARLLAECNSIIYQ